MERFCTFTRKSGGGGIFHCVISGGEPLILGNHLFEIMDILHDDGTSFLVISNGLLMTQDKAKHFKKYRYKWFQISIDGATSERHDNFRQHAGSWDAATKAVFMLSNLGIPVTVAHTVTPQNLDELDEMCDLAYSLGASSIICGSVMPSGRSFLNPEIIMNHEQKNIFADKIEKNVQRFSGKMLVQRSASTKVQLLRGLNTPNQGAIIRPNGDIRLDCVAPFTIGNVIDDDFFEVWRKKSRYVWGSPELIEYYESWNGEEEITTGIKNYFDDDVKL